MLRARAQGLARYMREHLGLKFLLSSFAYGVRSLHKISRKSARAM